MIEWTGILIAKANKIFYMVNPMLYKSNAEHLPYKIFP